MSWGFGGANDDGDISGGNVSVSELESEYDSNNLSEDEYAALQRLKKAIAASDEIIRRA